MNKKIVAINFEKEGTGFEDESMWNAKDYHYYALEDIEPGDLVVVKVHHKYKIVRVSKVLSQYEEVYASNYIIQKIDIDAYQKKQEDLLEQEIRDNEFRKLLDLEAHLTKYQEIIETTKSSRLKEIAEQKIKDIESQLN